MLARVCCRKGEAAAAVTPLGHNAVVVVKRFFYRYEDTCVGLGLVRFRVVVPYFCIIMAWLVFLAPCNFCRGIFFSLGNGKLCLTNNQRVLG